MKRAVLSMVLACVAAGSPGCRDVNGLGATGGRGTESLGPGAPIDAYESPRRDSALAIDAARPDAAPADGAIDTVNHEEACNACEAAQCRDVDDLDLYAMCFLATGRAAEGPGAGMLKSDLCVAVLRCARATGCSASDPQPCYCGPGVGDLQCLSGAANGACKTEIEIAAESGNAGVIASRSADPDYASGAAFNLLRYCEVPICHDACTGGVLPPDAGVPPDGASPDAGVPDAGVPDARPADAAPDAPPGPCADLDHDGVPDCTQTLVGNARFDHDAASWTAEFGATAAWDGAHDGLGDMTSGSLVATNNVVASATGTTMVGASQCIAAVPGASYHTAAQVLLAAGQGAGSAGLGAYFYGAAGCTGPITGVWASDPTSSTGTWTAIGGALVAPAGARAMAVRLVVVKPFSAPAFQAHFDNILVGTP